MKFSEVYFGSADQKLFDVKIGDFYIAKDLDPFYRAYNMYMPYDLFVELTIKQGKLYIDSKEVKGGIRKGNLIVDFMKGKADNPKVNALILV